MTQSPKKEDINLDMQGRAEFTDFPMLSVGKMV